MIHRIENSLYIVVRKGGIYRLNKGLVYGGVLLAIYTLMLFMVIYIPVIGFISLFLLPLPFIFMVLKNGTKWAFCLLAAAAFLSIIVGAIMSVSIAITFGLVGIIMGYHLKYDKSRLQMFISSVLLFILCSLFNFIVALQFFGVNYIEQSTNMVEESFQQSASILQSLGQTQQSEQLMERVQETFILFQTLIPSVLVISSIIFVGLVFLACKPIINRVSDKKLIIAPIGDIQLPKSLLWYYLIIMIGSLFISSELGNFSYTVIANLLFILQFFILLQGYSFLFFLCHVKGWPKAVPVVITILTTFLALTPFVRILGIIDLGFPLREKMASK